MKIPCSRSPALSAACWPNLQRVDAGAAKLVELHAQAGETLRELQTELSRYAGKMDVDPARLSEVEERLNLLHSLKRKYGATLGEVIAFGDEAKIKLQSLESRDAELARLNAALDKLDAEIASAGKKLSAARKKVIPPLAKAAGKQLADLGFKQSKFDVAISTTRWGETPSTEFSGKKSRADKSAPPIQPASTKSNSSSRRTPASRPSRCAPLPRPAKWRA